ncbi:peptide chain release factor 2 [Anaerotalea alkaliphila]|uniref:Peptide chain release factor 2 n=1 Tax=Anaerotalea alkaliphila TaxID=2662126 RepID=A0A7X5HVW9_9FIRM|nr:peptide chain release factor 2 [Anaerotalea alkaliphila]NDL67641.1 peptide chain release factor 2 [Anaerotalea alkaliphila]
MIQLEQMRQKLAGYSEKLIEMSESLDLAGASVKVEELEMEAAGEAFWQDQDRTQVVLKELKRLKDKIEEFRRLEQEYEDIQVMIDMGIEEGDEGVIQEVEGMTAKFLEDFEQIRVETLLSGEYDPNSAILTLHAGAGGTESCDWVSMLFRMYTRWAETKGYKVEVLDYLDGEEAGIKSVTIQVNGANAYGYLKSEKGVHRLVRISPFDSSGRRHTSFASCDVIPEIEEDIDLEIADDDIRIDTYRSSGAGGQHVNKTDSAIRITHLPTGIVVQCQNERSQHKNKDKAMHMLQIKLLELKRLEQLEKMAGIRGEIKEIGWGSQIRSYVMHPYSMVKDHRTEEESGNVQAVMDGKLDPFMNAYLKWLAIK